jgi:hypothetical protein
MSRVTVRYLVLLVAAIVCFYWRTLLTNQFTLIVGSEGVDQSYAWLHFWLHSVWQGHMPLWDRYAFAGSPFAGEALPTAFYPLRLIFALVPLNHSGVVSPRLFDEYLAFTHLLCAWFMFALLREMERTRLASFIGACAFSLGGLVIRMIWPQYIESAIWLPPVFLFLLRALRAERRDRALLEAALCGLSLGMSVLTGGMAFFIMQAIFVVTAICWYGAAKQSASDRRGLSADWANVVVILAVVSVVAGGFGAIQLLPASEYSHFSIRFIDGGPIGADQKIPYHRLVPGIFPQSIVTGLFANGFDGKLGGEEFFPYYIGVFPFFLAVIGIWKCWRNLWVRYLAGLAVVSFVYAWGSFSPLHGVLYAITPYLWLARSSDRFVYLTSFALAVLAAFGVDALLDPANRELWGPAKRVVKWVAITAAAALMVPAVFVQLNLSIWTAFSLLLILASCGWFFRLSAKDAPAGLRVALAVFVLFDLAAFSWTETSSVTGTGADRLNQMISLRGPAEYIRSRPGLHRVRVGVAPEPNIGDVYQIEAVFGGGPAMLTDYADLGGRDNLLNVRYTIRPASAADPAPVYFDGTWKVFENPAAFPRAWVVHQAVVVPSHKAAFSQLDQPGVDLHQVAVVETQSVPGMQPAAAADAVDFRSYEADRIAVDVNAASAGMLVLSEMYYPGWSAKVNGKAATIYRVDGALRGIPVAAGANHVELTYAPNSFRLGAALSFTTVIAVFAGWLRVGRHRPHLHWHRDQA